MSISSKDLDFLKQCNAIKSDSFDPDRQVGVAIVNPSGEVIATGTNKPPISIKISATQARRAIAKDPMWKYFMLEHAERNAIEMARRHNLSLNGSTIYATLFPCADCARALVSAGIERLVAPAPGADRARDRKWRDHYKYALEILTIAKVKIDYPLQSKDSPITARPKKSKVVRGNTRK